MHHFTDVRRLLVASEHNFIVHTGGKGGSRRGMTRGERIFQLLHFEVDELILGNHERRYINYYKARKVRRGCHFY